MNIAPAKTFDEASLSAVLRPIENANGLPNAHYVNADTFKAELGPLFADTWAAIGFVQQVSSPRDAFPVSFLGQPLVVIHGRDGKIRVFQNICRHRGMILIADAGPIRGAIRCPYHSWCYDLDGALKATPHVGGPGQNIHEGIDRDTLGLIEVRSHVWRDIVFVNLSGNAPDFEAANADLLERWKEFDGPLYHGGPESSFKLDVKCNWKLAVENYCESYHLPWVHPGLNSYSRLEDHYHIEEPGAFSGQGTHVYRQLRDDAGTTFADAKGLSPKWDEAAEYISLFPNVLLGVHRDHSFAIILEPKSEAETREHVEIYYHDESALAPNMEALRQKNAEQWKGVFEEDIFAVEGMQTGRSAGGFDGGRFSPVMDNPTHLFHQWVAGRLNAALP